MDKINAVITGVGGYVPEDVLTNEDISKMVDTTDEWIMTRVGIKERRILKGEGVGLSYMGIRAVKQLLEKTNLNPEEVEVVLTATTTPDHHFPTTSSIIAYHTGCKNAMTFDMQGACAGFLYALETGANYIRSGRYKKVVVVSGDKMTSITDYQDRSTCPLFGDACGAVLLEPTTEEFGVLDTILRTDGVGYPHLIMKSGGSAYPPSHETVDNREHFVYQDGRVVFKYAVSYMADVAAEIAEKNGLTHDDIAWIVPHQANLRIIDATAKRLGHLQTTVFFVFVNGHGIVTDGVFRTVRNDECLNVLQVIHIQQNISLCGCVCQQRAAVMAEECWSDLSDFFANVRYIGVILAAP